MMTHDDDRYDGGRRQDSRPVPGLRSRSNSQRKVGGHRSTDRCNSSDSSPRSRSRSRNKGGSQGEQNRHDSPDSSSKSAVSTPPVPGLTSTSGAPYADLPGSFRNGRIFWSRSVAELHVQLVVSLDAVVYGNVPETALCSCCPRSLAQE